MRNDFKRKPSSLACVFGELEPRMSSQNAMILSLFDFKESMTGHKILSHRYGPKDVPKGMHTLSCHDYRQFGSWGRTAN